MIEAWSETDLWPGGSSELLIVGPPGTGKTTKALEHYVWPVLRDGGVVLATSYTRAAAGELRDRTAKELGGTPESYSQELSTIHSEAGRRCHGLGFKVGQDRDEDGDEKGDPTLVELVARVEEESKRTGLAAWDRTRNLYPDDIGQPVEARLRRVGLYGTALDEAVVAVNRDMHGRYRDGVLVRPDFTQLLEEATIRGAERAVDLLAIDEAQDLSPLQWALLDRWAATARRILIVGDPDQSIYTYAGADGRRLLRWIRTGRCTRRLSQSHRVPRLPRRLARRIIRQVADREDAPYTPADRDGTVTPITGDDAFYRVAAAQDAGESVFVLSRSRAGCAAAVDDLERLDIPYIGERGGSLLGRPGAPSVTLDVVEALLDLEARRALTPGAARRLVRAMSTTGLHTLRRGAKGELGALVKDKRGRIPFDDLEDAGMPTDELVRVLRSESEAEAARVFLPSVVAAPDVVRAVRWVRRWGDQLLAVASRVIVTTAHGSKGRQADVVVVDARRCFRGHRSEADLNEDRRVLYVALTRTQRDLVLLGREWLDAHGLTVWGDLG